MVVLTKINVTSVSAKLTLSLRAFSTQRNLTVEAQCMFNIGYACNLVLVIHHCQCMEKQTSISVNIASAETKSSPIHSTLRPKTEMMLRDIVAA